jgi:uncharacterized repeat protein (TIGR03803 family)
MDYHRTCAVLSLYVATVLASRAQTFNKLVDFNGNNGSSPQLSLVQGTDGNFYGTTYSGGANNNCHLGCGTIFMVTPSGALTTVYNFAGTDGSAPYAGLILGADGNFYGTTVGGGANNVGTVFKVTPGGVLTTLYSFDRVHGRSPYAPLVQGLNGYFYGTTLYGGANDDGTIFAITPAGELYTLHSFDYTDGQYPYGGLFQATDGDFWGTTELGGSQRFGTVFKMSPAGVLTTVYGLGLAVDGANPYDGVVEATDGNFYGTTLYGGSNYDGTVFKLTPGGTLTSLYGFGSMHSQPVPAFPIAPLIQATDGRLYGTTSDGGNPGPGAIFRITLTGTLETLHGFNGTDGSSPNGGVVQGTDGNFYGATPSGGANDEGTLYSLSVGLGPFVRAVPQAAQVGTAIIILGTNLAGATSVAFNGTMAAFTVVSATEITATVPAGATTGHIQVTTPAGTLGGAGPFFVVPVS